jgi:hypothetical protein
MDTIYRQRANARWEYWTYSEGERYWITEAVALRWVALKTARLVHVQ